MEVVKVTRNYQVTIPANIRKKLKLKIGDKLIISLDEKEKVIKIKKMDELDKVLSLLDELPKSSVNWDEIKKEYYEAKGNY